MGVARTPRDGGVGMRVLGAYQSARDVALEGGTNQVLRFLVGAALTYQLQWWRVLAAGDVGLVGTLARAQGSGYDSNGSDTALNTGAIAELRGAFVLAELVSG